MLHPAEIQRLRAETAGTRHVAHFNHAGSSLPPDPVRDLVAAYWMEESLRGGYELEALRQAELEGVYASLARLIGASPDEIALAESATFAWNIAFQGLGLQAGDVVLSTQAEYGSNYLAFLSAAEQRGIEIRLAPDAAPGQLDLAALERQLDERVKLISLVHVPTNSGRVLPAAQVGRLARAHGIPYLLDACQSAGQMPLDVEALGCDFLAATGRKYLRGPRGTGFLYIRRARLEQLRPLMPDNFSAEWLSPEHYRLRPDARRFEQFESSRALRLGLGKAAEYFLEIGPERAYGQIQHVATRLRARLATLPGIQVYDPGQDLCGIVTFAHETLPAAEIQAILLRRRIQTSLSRPGGALLDVRARRLPTLLRASVHYLTTEAECDQLCEALAEIIAI